jgi:hypothetical protein
MVGNAHQRHSSCAAVLVVIMSFWRGAGSVGVGMVSVDGGLVRMLGLLTAWLVALLMCHISLLDYVAGLPRHGIHILMTCTYDVHMFWLCY